MTATKIPSLARTCAKVKGCNVRIDGNDPTGELASKASVAPLGFLRSHDKSAASSSSAITTIESVATATNMDAVERANDEDGNWDGEDEGLGIGTKKYHNQSKWCAWASSGVAEGRSAVSVACAAGAEKGDMSSQPKIPFSQRSAECADKLYFKSSSDEVASSCPRSLKSRVGMGDWRATDAAAHWPSECKDLVKRTTEEHECLLEQ